MSKRFLIILAVLVLGFIGFIVYQGQKDSPSGPDQDFAQATNHTQGAGNKDVTLIEYGDFQCPSCGSYYPVLKEIKQKYGDDITFQFRHFPLTQIHPNAMAAHRAAEAASKQDKFWEMHDLLYERQKVWSGSTNVAQVMEDYATELGINVDQFKEDYQSSAVNAAINADIKVGATFKITGTPSFILNGKKIEESPQSIEEFTKLIDEAIAGQQQATGN